VENFRIYLFVKVRNIENGNRLFIQECKRKWKENVEAMKNFWISNDSCTIYGGKSRILQLMEESTGFLGKLKTEPVINWTQKQRRHWKENSECPNAK
jgi:hypothetical protein